MSTEEAVDGAEPVRVANPRGLLVLDAAGWAFEAVTRDNRLRPTPAQARFPRRSWPLPPLPAHGAATPRTPPRRQMTLRPEGAFSPNVMGRELSRSYAVTGDRLVVTSKPGEPHARGATRWTWERVPPVENLSPGYRQVVGFWRHEVESRVNLTLKTEVSTKRAPSVIVYTPSGYVGVHFPALNRKPFASDAAHRRRGQGGAARLRRLLRRAGRLSRPGLSPDPRAAPCRPAARSSASSTSRAAATR